MRPIVIVSGVLGGGSALVFAAAAVVASLFPNGTLVAANPWGDGRFVRAMPAIGAPVMVNDTSGGGWTGPAPVTVGGGGVALPPDVVVPDVGAGRDAEPVMRAGLVVTGVLGTGTVLVFALAGLVATLFPNGTLVASGWSGGFGGGGGRKGRRRRSRRSRCRPPAVPEKGVRDPGRDRPDEHGRGPPAAALTRRAPGRAEGGATPPTLYSAGHALPLTILRQQRPRAGQDPAADRSHQRARARVRGPLRRRDPRADRPDPRRDRGGGGARGALRRRAPPPGPRAAPRPHQGAPQARERAAPEGARRADPRGVRRRPRGHEADDGDAPVRRPADGRDRAPPGPDRRDADRRGQDPHPDARRGAQRPHRPGRPRRDRQRLPRAPRRAMDGPGLPLPRPVGGRHHPRHVVPVRARLPDDRRAADQPAAR